MKIILAFDGDKAGTMATLRCAKQILEYQETPRQYFNWLMFLASKNFKPTLEEIEQYTEDEMNFYKNAQILYEEWKNKQLSPKEREEFFPEVSEHQRIEARKNYLFNKFQILTERFYNGDQLAGKKRWHIYNQYHIFLGEKIAITDSDIKLAREHPIRNLLKINTNNFALCPFHKEKTPSFYTKNNFGYCFGCGYKGDVIDIAMKLNNWSFLEAVKNLI